MKVETATFSKISLPQKVKKTDKTIHRKIKLRYPCFSLSIDCTLIQFYQLSKISKSQFSETSFGKSDKIIMSKKRERRKRRRRNQESGIGI